MPEFFLNSAENPSPSKVLRQMRFDGKLADIRVCGMVILMGCPLVPRTLILSVPGVHRALTSGPAVCMSENLGPPVLVNADIMSVLMRLSGEHPESIISPPPGVCGGKNGSRVR